MACGIPYSINLRGSTSPSPQTRNSSSESSECEDARECREPLIQKQGLIRVWGLGYRENCALHAFRVQGQG